MNIFHISEVAEMGIEKEKKRRDFYAAAAEAFDDQELKKLFTQLKEWEEQHVRKFTEIRDSIPEGASTNTYPGELSGYMSALIDEKIYSRITREDFKKYVKGPLDAINFGIQFEKDAILFFNAIEPYIDMPQKEMIKTFIDQEKQHLVYLHNMRKNFDALPDTKER